MKNGVEDVNGQDKIENKSEEDMVTLTCDQDVLNVSYWLYQSQILKTSSGNTNSDQNPQTKE